MHYTAFIDTKKIAEGELENVIRAVKARVTDLEALLIETESCQRQDLDWRGSADAVFARLAPAALGVAADPIPAKRGRPRLGVVSKEITLLPRHWDWLASQTGGASVTLRRMIDQARKHIEPEEQIKQQQAGIFKFITIYAEQLPDVEEATRALYRKDADLLNQAMAHWPVDIQDFVRARFKQMLSRKPDA